MAKLSFAAQKTVLDEACMFLRSFTLGQHGFSPSDGNAGIERVNKQCDRVAKLFASGPDAKQAELIVASARTRVKAAQSRLSLLAKK